MREGWLSLGGGLVQKLNDQDPNTFSLCYECKKKKKKLARFGQSAEASERPRRKSIRLYVLKMIWIKIQ